MSQPPSLSFNPWTPPLNPPALASSSSSKSTDSVAAASLPPSGPAPWTSAFNQTLKAVMSGPKPSAFLSPNDGPFNFDARVRRPVLSNVTINGLDKTTMALPSPATTAESRNIWGPPGKTNPIMEAEASVASLQTLVRALTLENQELRRCLARQETIDVRFTPLTSPANSMHGDAEATSGFGQQTRNLVRPGEDLTASLGLGATESENYIPPDHLIASVLHGSLNLSDMPPEYIRPVVWVVAHRQPRNNSESAGLKSAVNSLAGRLSLPRGSDPATILINAIIEWAKKLCFTSCGNYLCQQLLERGEPEDRLKFIDKIKDDLVAIASDKFGTHVLCKAIAFKELEAPISEALLAHGIYDSLKTGARRLWREYLEKCRQAHNLEIFDKINTAMKGRWADLACANENGSIAVQQVFEVFGTPELMEPCFREILADVSRVANNQSGHFVITKLLAYPSLFIPTCEAILSAYPPVALTHHGVNFAKIAITEGPKGSLVKYLDAICQQEEGHTPGIVAIATSSIGKSHLSFVISCLTPAEHIRIRQVCRAYSTTLRNSQSGNDLLRSLGLIHAVGARRPAA